MRTLLRWIRGLLNCLPAQLLRSQLATQKGLLLFWVFIFLIVSDNLLTDFGGPKLFLEPEYRGAFGVTSMFLLGLAFGLFVFAFQLSCFILDGYRFLFIAYLTRPLRVFALNNSLLPLVFVFVYTLGFIRFHLEHNDPTAWELIFWLVALFAGQLLVLAFSTFYFWFLSRRITKALTDRLMNNLQAGQRLVRRVELVEERVSRVSWFFTTNLRTRRAVNTFRGNSASFRRTMTRHHGVALLVMFMYLVVLIVVGSNYDNPAFFFPAGASTLILFSLLMMLVGAMTYWFRQMGLLVVLVLGLWLSWINSKPEVAGTHPAFGLDYATEAATYSLGHLKTLAGADSAGRDIALTEAMLARWRADYERQTGDSKPKLVLLCTSGGGLRAATWTVTALQALDSATQGRFRQHLRLITGASGGMMGAAYWRDLQYQQLTDSTFYYPSEAIQRQRISRDLFNRVVFFGIINLFSPTGTYPYNGTDYARDRGYAFEDQLIENTLAFEGRVLDDYAPWVSAARLPMLVFTPAILNDGRQLVAADLPAAYLCTADSFNAVYSNEVPAVELRRLLAAQGAGQLRFTSLIRMNASFPYVLPFVELPTQPRTEVLDAGAIDNFGVSMAVRFAFRLRQWIRENTGGVVLVMVRDTRSEQLNLKLPKPTPFQKLLSVFGSTYNSIAEARDFSNDDLLTYTKTFLGCPFEVVELPYTPQPTFQGAALNFHLTRREKRDISEAIHNPSNQATLQRMAELLTPPNLP